MCKNRVWLDSALVVLISAGLLYGCSADHANNQLSTQGIDQVYSLNATRLTKTIDLISMILNEDSPALTYQITATDSSAAYTDLALTQ
jgi:hypothetical protein